MKLQLLVGHSRGKQLIAISFFVAEIVIEIYRVSSTGN